MLARHVDAQLLVANLDTSIGRKIELVHQYIGILIYLFIGGISDAKVLKVNLVVTIGLGNNVWISFQN